MANLITTGDTPQMSSTFYTSTTTPIGNVIGGINSIPSFSPFEVTGDNTLWREVDRGFQKFDAKENLHQVVQAARAAINRRENDMARRIVQVFIADTDENVPLEKSVIYTGEQKLTDSTDQELFFEINIKDILTKHNAYRITLVNKKVKERVENLEPVKIRDLKMVVVNIAEFK